MNQLEEMNYSKESIEYAGFWIRFGAYFLDGLIVGLTSIGLNYLNFYNSKSFSIYLIITVIGLLYKPFLEYKYGATIGKMLTDLKVTDIDFQAIDFQKSLIRSSIFILPVIIMIPIQFLAYQNPELNKIDDFWLFSTALTQTYPLQGFFSCFASILMITDLIVLTTDETKTHRSLHDRIAKTYVIKIKK